MQIKKDFIIVFDLDGTIISTNSFHEFIKYEIRNRSIKGKMEIVESTVLRKLSLITSIEFKNRILSFYKGKNQETLGGLFLSFYRTLSKYNDPKIISIIESYLKNDYEVIIITGALYDYAKFFCEQLKVNAIFATKLLYDDDLVFTGSIIEPEVLGVHKKNIVNELFKNKKVVFYTDSYIDKPLLDYSHKGYLVNLKKSTKNIIYYRQNVKNKNLGN